MDNKAQTAVEYLLVLAAVVAIAAVVIALLANLTGDTKNVANDTLGHFLSNL
jgi:uncharacterized protein (UPF0333 family)